MLTENMHCFMIEHLDLCQAENGACNLLAKLRHSVLSDLIGPYSE
jgi:hypothetical protein